MTQKQFYPDMLVLIMSISPIVLIGCSPVDPTKRLETTCADSFKLSLKDPDSITIVANLGTRGVTDDEGKGFWLRYKAKNGYGAFESSNVYCMINTVDSAQRNEAHESLVFMQERNSIQAAKIRGLRAGESMASLEWGDYEEHARKNVFDGVENLLRYDMLYKTAVDSPVTTALPSK